MHSKNPSRAMDQRIFHVDLSTEAVSAYLLCCGLADEEKRISIKNLLNIWNSTETALLNSLKTLEEKKIIQELMTDHEGNTVYELTDVHEWACAQRR